MRFSDWIAARRRRVPQSSTAPSGPAPIRVLYLFPEAYLNSPWYMVYLIIRYAAPNGIDPLVVLGEHTKGALDGVDSVPVIRMHFGGLAQFRSILTLRRLVLSSNIDLIHVVDSGPSLFCGTLLSLLSRTPLIIHFHSIPRLWGFKKRVALRVISTVASAIVGVSKFVRLGIEQYIGIRSSALTWVHNGVDVLRFSPAVDGTSMRSALGFKLGATAVIEPARFWMLKGQRDLVTAVAIARKQNPSIELALIGWNDTSYSGQGRRAEIEELIASLGLGDAVRCFDATPLAQEIYAAADIVCLPSLDEPFGLVAIEAQAAERAFIGVNSGALPEIVTDGVNGLLVKPKCPHAIAAALVRLAGDASLRAELARHGRNRACQHFNDSLLAPRFAAIYGAVLSGRPLPTQTI
jgi:glycosyltransferase involved in cell wall biosynthesis